MRPKDGQTAASEQLLQRLGTGVREICVGSIASLEPVPHIRLAFGIGERGIQSLERRADLGTQQLPKQRQLWCLMRPLAQHDLDQLSITPQHRGVVGLSEIVIVSGDPEHRHHRDSAFSLDPLRQGHRRQGLVNRVERSREERGLLPGRDRQDFPGGETLATGPRQDRGEYVGMHTAWLAGGQRCRRHR